MIKSTLGFVATTLLSSIALAQSAPPAPKTASPAPSASPAAETLPTTEQLKQMLADKKYSDVIKESTRILRLRPEAQAGYDKGQVQMLQGEAHLQLKHQGPAAQAFEQAAKDAKDPSDAALAQATATLIKKSPGMTYRSKPAAGAAPGTAPSAGFNIADPEGRKSAFAALFDSEWSAAQTKIQSLKTQGSIPAFMKGLEEISGLRAMEEAGTGSDTKTQSALKELGESAHETIAQWLDQQSKRVDDIAEDVRKSAQNLGDGISTQRGLSARETQDLRDIVANCDRLGPAMKELSEASGATGAAPPAATSRPAQPPPGATGKAGRPGKPEAAGAHASANLNVEVEDLKRRAERLLNTEQSQVQRGGQMPGQTGGYGGQGQGVRPQRPR